MVLSEENKAVVGQALGRLPSGIGILTTAAGEQQAAMLASWFQQCSFDPPMISVAMKRGRAAEGALGESRKFVLNLLREDQKKLLGHFGKGFKPGEDPFVGIEVALGAKTDLPVLVDCLAALECEVRDIYDAGDHQLLVGEVVGAVAAKEGAPMVHLRRSGFHY